MSKTADFLVELGTEELPPKALLTLRDAFARGVRDGLADARLAHGDVLAYATPRRLAVLVEALETEQPVQTIENRGPPTRLAYDEDGKPTKATEAFAKKCGVAIGELDTLSTDKGEWLFYKGEVAGKPAAELLGDIVNRSLAALPIPKRMRWGASDVEFVRPAHWLVMLLGTDVVAAEALGLTAGNTTQGHRFHAPGPITLHHANDYESALEAAKVTVDFELRKTTIKTQLDDAASKLSAVLDYDDLLLEEVTNLVERPVPIIGEFSASFLEIPQEALVATMQEAQRYFPLYNKSDHKLLPHFIIISNIESKNPEVIKKGNERVIKPRFEDAAFFWNRDKSRRLDSRLENLSGVLFEKQLGSLLDKTKRIESLAEKLAVSIDLDPKHAKRAATLCKCDLLTEMVNEFPKLQGIMGRYYAEHDGEPNEVAIAIQEHYQPTQAGGDIPSYNTGRIIAISDRIDTLAGIFATGKKPTGIKDPYALRRAALGIIRIAIKGQIDFDLPALLSHAVNLLPNTLDTSSTTAEVEEFIYERLRGYFNETGYQLDTIDAVRNVGPASLVDFHRRVQAVHEFRKLPEADSLAAANKRIRNILKKIDDITDLQIDNRLLGDGAERNLYENLIAMEKSVAPVIADGEYSKALTSLATLKSTIDLFFDDVMVMDEADDIRNNRIALVSRVKNQFAAIADISCLQN